VSTDTIKNIFEWLRGKNVKEYKEEGWSIYLFFLILGKGNI
jgi:hypothetical protein